MIFVLNCGFYNTKVKTISCRDVFATKVQENETGNRTLIINNCGYEIGVGNRDINDKKINIAHDVCTKYSILKYATSPNLSLVSALPMSLYLNRDYRESYRDNLIGYHTGVVDGIDKKVYVKECTIFAEGAAAYLPYKSILRDKVIGILDFGGNTINCMIYENGNLLKHTISTLDLGMIKLERSIIDALNTLNPSWNVQDYEIREIIRTGECKEIVDKCIREHLKEVRQRLLEKKWNIDRITIFATGGGSLQLKDQLEKTFKRVIVSQNGLYDNVEGLWLVGRELYEKKY